MRTLCCQVFVCMTLISITACARSTETPQVSQQTKSSAQKTLDEASAKEMTQLYINASDEHNHGDMYTDLSAIVPLLGKDTFANYKTSSQSGGRDAEAVKQLQILLRNGVVEQKENAVTLPDLSGSYEYVGSDRWTQFTEFDLKMTPGSPHVTGTYATIYNGQPNKRGPIEGDVLSQTSVFLDFTVNLNVVPSHDEANYAIRNADGHWRLESDEFRAVARDSKFRGQGPATTLQVPRFTYSLSPSIAPFRAPFDKPDELHIRTGHVRVERVTNLLLASETAATASFQWTLDQAVGLPGPLPLQSAKSGNGHVEFGKRPDGAWVVANVPSFN